MTASTAPYQLMDTDGVSLLGTYASEREALHAVAAAVEKYGNDSEAVVNLVLFCEDVPEDEAFIAEGADLVRRALGAVKTDGVAPPTPDGSGRREPASGSTNGSRRDDQAGSRKGSKATT